MPGLIVFLINFYRLRPRKNKPTTSLGSKDDKTKNKISKTEDHKIDSNKKASPKKLSQDKITNQTSVKKNFILFYFRSNKK